MLVLTRFLAHAGLGPWSIAGEGRRVNPMRNAECGVRIAECRMKSKLQTTNSNAQSFPRRFRAPFACPPSCPPKPRRRRKPVGRRREPVAQATACRSVVARRFRWHSGRKAPKCPEMPRFALDFTRFAPEKPSFCLVLNGATRGDVTARRNLGAIGTPFAHGLNRRGAEDAEGGWGNPASSSTSGFAPRATP